MKINAYAVYVENLTLNGQVLDSNFPSQDIIKKILGPEITVIPLTPKNCFMIRSNNMEQLQEAIEKITKHF